MGPNIHVKLNQDTLKVIIYGAVLPIVMKDSTTKEGQALESVTGQTVKS